MKLTTLILVFGIAFSVLGQEVEKTEYNKNELSVDLSDLFKTVALPGIIYKRHFANGAFRTRVNFNFSNQSTEADFPAVGNVMNGSKVFTDVNAYGLDLFMGYQWNRHLAKKLVFFYGVDALLSTGSYDQNQRTRYLDSSGEVEYEMITKNNNSYTSIGLAPVLGFRYHVSKSFALGFESFFTAFYTMNKSAFSVDRIVGSDLPLVGNSTEASFFGLNLRPSTLLVVGYYF